MELQRTLIKMGAFTMAVLAISFYLQETLISIFASNIFLNSLILILLGCGIAYSYSLVLRLSPELRWLDSLSQDRPIIMQGSPLKFLTPLAKLLAENSNVSAPTIKIFTDNIKQRLNESQDIIRYLAGILVFLGLLGTFWGLSLTIGSISSVIGSLPTNSGAATGFFDQLKLGLQSPLRGMGVAFSSSLFGLAASLILGFFNLQTSKYLSHFCCNLDEKLADNTNFKAIADFQTQTSNDFKQAIIEQLIEALETFQRTVSLAENSKNQLNSHLHKLCEKLDKLTDQRFLEMDKLQKLVKGIQVFQQHLQIFSNKITDGDFGLDSGSQNHLRNLDSAVNRILEEISAARQPLLEEFKKELRILTKSLDKATKQQAA